MLKTVLNNAIMAGGEQISKFFNQSFEISYKEGRNNLVTAADYASEKAILEVIKNAFRKRFSVGLLVVQYTDKLFQIVHSIASQKVFSYRDILAGCLRGTRTKCIIFYFSWPCNI